MNDKAQLRRIHIVGGPGSGKTTLAQQLASALSAPAHELDVVAYENGSGAKRTLALRLCDIKQIVAQPGWISEGIYLWWTDELLHTADKIVWLDLPWRIAAWRIVARHVRADLAGNNRHSGWLKLLRFLRSVRAYYADQRRWPPITLDDDGANCRAATAHNLKPFSDKLIHCRRTADVQKFLLSVQSVQLH